MPKARLYFDGDGVYIDKEKRIYQFTQDIVDKINSIPDVIDNTDSTSTTDALSANMGRYLQDQINNLAGAAHFLSGWDATTGLPITEPAVDPYTYMAGDYYIVNNVAGSGGTNYRPHGSIYTQGVPSTAVETGNPEINDWYMYDGANWILQKTATPIIVVDSALDSTSTNPVENRAIAQELAGKQNVIADLQTIRDGAAAGATAIQSGDNITRLVNNANYITAGYVSWGNISGTLSNQTDLQNALNNKQDKLTAGTGITIDANNVISSSASGGVWGQITGTLNDQTDLKNALDGKQKKLTAGNNIFIANDGTISATDTTYTAGNGINIDGNNEISNTAQFSPDNSGSVGQVIKKTANGYEWANESGGGATYSAGEGIAIDGNNEISIDMTGATNGQVLSTDGSGHASWITPSGGATYTAGDGIRIDSSNVISNTMYPSTQGAAGQVLKADGNGDTYWANDNDTTYGAGDGVSIDSSRNISIDTTGATAGQVLSVNAQGNTTWTTPSGGATYTAGDGINIDASNIVSNTMYPTNQGSAGQVLKIDGNGDTYWANESGGGGETIGAGERIYLQRNAQIRDNKGPCQDGWHVPTNTEMQALFQHMSDLGFDDTHPSDYETYLHMPMWGHLEHSVDTIHTRAAYYWTCEMDSSYGDNANALGISTVSGVTRFSIAKSWAAFIRPFKDTVEVPDQYWTTVYDGSSVAAGAGIFTNWSGEFISVSGDGTNWVTIYNKNLGARDQWEPGYVPANSNAGLFYQWGNNHGFTGDSGDWSYYTVSASGYGPGNYYDKSTFITCQGMDVSWDSSRNDNLWGGATQSTGTYTLINAEQVNQATANTIGGIKLGSDTIQTEPVQSPTSDSGRTFPIQLDRYGNAVVNVPGGGGGGVSIKQYTTYTSAGTANKEVYNLDISAGDLVSVRFANGNSASDVYIVDSTDPTISYPVTIGGASTNNNNFHVAHGGEVLMYFNGGALCAYSTMEDTIYTAGTGISISSDSISNTGVTSVNNSTGDVTVNEVSSGGNTGQVLTKTNNGYGWSNAPVTSVNSSTGDVTIRDVPASGSIGAVLTRINASNWGYDWQTISQFAPSNSQSATAGQILKKTQNGYEWADEYSNASNVRSWNVYGTPTNAQMKEIFFWLLDSYASNYLQGCAILKSTSQLDTYVFDYVTYTMEGSDTIINLVFLGIQRVSEVVRHATSGTGDYTHARARRMTISVNVGDLQNPNPETFTYSAVEDWNTDSSQITNYLSCIGSGYTTPFIPTQDHQPTSKKYVDDVAAGKVSDGAYDATTWNGVTTIAPSKNAVRDKIEDVISTLTPGLSVISGDSGTDYQIKIASMNPSTGTNNNIITLVI